MGGLFLCTSTMHQLQLIPRNDARLISCVSNIRFFETSLFIFFRASAAFGDFLGYFWCCCYWHNVLQSELFSLSKNWRQTPSCDAEKMHDYYFFFNWSVGPVLVQTITNLAFESECKHTKTWTKTWSGSLVYIKRCYVFVYNTWHMALACLAPTLCSDVTDIHVI